MSQLVFPDDLDEITWAWAQTNGPLLSEDQVGVAKEFMSRRGLPFHNDRWKNWDNMIAINHVVCSTNKNSSILDAGATRDPSSPSVFLQGLRYLGYKNLFGCNLDEGERDTVHEGAVYSKQDIQKTSYPDGIFSFIACLSVIEHGVDYEKYFAEMARILKHGGRLFTSFDYWPDPINTGDRRAFGAPVKIFTEDDVMDMIVFAATQGLRITSSTAFDVAAPVVNWLGLDYTFYNLLLRKI